jgi:signal transduction histidine kinase/putative methionine-R-sulfoxide reductase with GAF domain
VNPVGKGFRPARFRRLWQTPSVQARSKTSGIDAKQQLAILGEIQNLLTRNYAGSRQFLNRVLETATSLVGLDSGFIGLLQDDGDRPVVRVWDRFHRLVGATVGHWDTFVRDLPVGGDDLPARMRSLTGKVAHTRRPRRIRDARHATFFRADNKGTRSALAVPVLSHGEVLAVIYLESNVVKFYEKTHESIVVLIATMIAPRLEQLMMREGLRGTRRTFLDKLSCELGAIPAGTYDWTSFNRVATLIAAQLQRPCCRIWLLDAAETTLLIRGCSGRRGRRTRTITAAPLTDPLWLAVVGARGNPGSPTHKRRTGGWVHGDGASDADVIAIPILVGGRATGVLEVAGRRRGRGKQRDAFSPSDAELLQIVQGQISSALEIKALGVAHRREVVSLAKRRSVLADIFAEPNLERTLQAIVNRIPGLIGCGGCSIFIWNATRRTFTLRVSNSLPVGLYGVAEYRPGEGLTGWVGKHGRALNLANRTAAELARVAKDLHWKAKYEDMSARPDFRQLPFLAVPIFIDGHSRGIIRTSGRVRQKAFSDTDLETLTAVASHLTSVIAFQRHADERVHLLEALHRTTSSLDRRLATWKEGESPSPVRAILEESLEVARQALNADVMTLYPYDAESREFHTPPICAGVINCPSRMQGRLRDNDAPWQVLRKGARFRQHRNGSRPVADRPAADREALGFVDREGIVSSEGLRLAVAGRPVAVLFVNYRRRQTFDSAHRDFLVPFRSTLALTIEIARLYRRMRQAASEEVSSFLAQDLHDMVLTFLTGSALERCAALRTRLQQKQTDEAVADLTTIESVIRHTVSELRNVMGLAIVGQLQEHGLVRELQRHRRAVWDDQDCFVDIADSDVQLPLQVQYQFYMIVASAVANAISYGRATHVLVEIVEEGDRAQLRIKDDGAGFDPPTALELESHFGLRGIRRRARCLGGDARYESECGGGGTTIIVDIPLTGGLYDGDSQSGRPH